jgi:hypothetical protein
MNDNIELDAAMIAKSTQTALGSAARPLDFIQ